MGGLGALTPTGTNDPAAVASGNFQVVHLSWLVISIVYGLFVSTGADRILAASTRSRDPKGPLKKFKKINDSMSERYRLLIARSVFLFIAAGLSIHLFYLVGKSIMEFGTCKLV